MTIVEIDLEKMHGLRCISVFLYFCSLSLFLMQPATENLLSRNQPREKKWTHKIPTRITFGPT